MPPPCKNPIFFIILHFLTCYNFLTTTSPNPNYTTTTVNRRFLHQPLYPLDHFLPLTTQREPPYSSPRPQLQLQPKYPFSYLSPPITPQTQNPFFPFYSYPPPPPFFAFSTFPASISSLILPHSSSSSNKPISHKLITVIVSVSILFAAVIAAVVAFFLLHHHPPSSNTDNIRLFPPNATPSDSTTTTKNHLYDRRLFRSCPAIPSPPQARNFSTWEQL